MAETPLWGVLEFNRKAANATCVCFGFESESHAGVAARLWQRMEALLNKKRASHHVYLPYAAPASILEVPQGRGDGYYGLPADFPTCVNEEVMANIKLMFYDEYRSKMRKKNKGDMYKVERKLFGKICAHVDAVPDDIPRVGSSKGMSLRIVCTLASGRPTLDEAMTVAHYEPPVEKVAPVKQRVVDEEDSIEDSGEDVQPARTLETFWAAPMKIK